MSAHCQVTGRSPGFGNTVSHSHRRTPRRWNPNIQTKSYFLPSEGRRITLRVSTKGIKVIDRDGIEAVVARIRRNGEKSDGAHRHSTRGEASVHGRHRVYLRHPEEPAQRPGSIGTTEVRSSRPASRRLSGGTLMAKGQQRRKLLARW
jgi:large subunit ribosomal protein L28